MTEITHCPNCKTELKGGLRSKVQLLNSKEIDIINEYNSTQSKAYCTNCGKELAKKYKAQLLVEKEEIANKIRRLINLIPVISIHTPLNWDYKVITMVTGQTTTGTGVLTEFTSSLSDLFGGQSKKHNQKIKAGEYLCYAQLRKQTLDVGGNAVIATDIDYAELGSVKGMIMVCMAGTAIKLNNLDVLGQKRANHIAEVVSLNERLIHLTNLDA
jgi:uncharacterized protein YbjQ (UPF0145 family)